MKKAFSLFPFQKVLVEKALDALVKNYNTLAISPRRSGKKIMTA